MIQVLLATFNGERFLREQIDSILCQTYPAVQVLASDDGSRDATPEILREYATRFPETVQLLHGTPTGSAKSNFRRLMQASTAPYIAFADQDDVWLPQKLATELQAVHGLEQHHGASMPLLVFSDLEVVTAELRPMASSLWQRQQLQPANIHRFPRLLMQNVVTGCTMLANRSLLELAQDIPEEAAMHDWWIALVACAFGHAEYLEDKLVRYRQHSTNVLGAQTPVELRKLPRLRDHTNRRAQWEQIIVQARSFQRTYNTILPADAAATLLDLERVETSTSPFDRVWTMLRRGFLLTPLRATLALVWYLWDRQASF
ncbi:MAG TPA: glycosyltransferase family 2 protein [Acidobacteriaceae bacterium]|jgi:glycosyltransferase involved in cell wall biosynthesis